MSPGSTSWRLGDLRLRLPTRLRTRNVRALIDHWPAGWSFREGHVGTPQPRNAGPEFTSSSDPQAVTISRPAASKRPKSSGFVVAMDAPTRSATAAIMQSVREPRRRPARLNNRAVPAESSAVNSTGSPTIRVANATSSASTGPQRNSAHDTALMPTVDASWSQARSRRSSGHPRVSARIRKLVSRWITESGDGARTPAAQRGHDSPRRGRRSRSDRASAARRRAPQSRRSPAPRRERQRGSRGGAPRTSTPPSPRDPLQRPDRLDVQSVCRLNGLGGHTGSSIAIP